MGAFSKLSQLHPLGGGGTDVSLGRALDFIGPHFGCSQRDQARSCRRERSGRGMLPYTGNPREVDRGGVTGLAP